MVLKNLIAYIMAVNITSNMNFYIKYVRYISTPIVFIEDIILLLVVLTAII
jgi:hypothetical protein